MVSYYYGILVMYIYYQAYLERLQDLLINAPLIPKIAEHIQKSGGRALLVGGAVRDLLIGQPYHDLDIEVYDVSLEQLAAILQHFGRVNYVGKAFGVLRLEHSDIDWSIPRRDSAGRKPEVTLTPHVSFEEAFRRRDLTINAMGLDIHTGELIDPFNGLSDLKNNILRAPDLTLFSEDPLRFYRVMQFIGRFAMQPTSELNTLCSTMDISGVARERIEQEFEKLCLKSYRPSLGLQWLADINRLSDVLPELAACKNIPQEPEWHPEGDVFEHTKQAFDISAHLLYSSDQQKLTIMLAALCHDLGKVYTTRVIKGRIRSMGHAAAGVAPAQKLLQRITTKKELICTICVLVRYHMAPLEFIKSHAKAPAYKRLALKLAPRVSISMLGLLARADKSGRDKNPGEPVPKVLPDLEEFLQRAQRAGVLEGPEKPLLSGQDLQGIIPPGPEMGALLQRAYNLQIDKNITDKEVLKKRVLSKFSTQKN